MGILNVVISRCTGHHLILIGMLVCMMTVATIIILAEIIADLIVTAYWLSRSSGGPEIGPLSSTNPWLYPNV